MVIEKTKIRAEILIGWFYDRTGEPFLQLWPNNHKMANIPLYREKKKKEILVIIKEDKHYTRKWDNIEDMRMAYSIILSGDMKVQHKLCRIDKSIRDVMEYRRMQNINRQSEK